MLAAAAVGAACNESSVVGYDEDSLDVVSCAKDAPLPRCDEAACVVRELAAAQVGSTAIAADDDAVYDLEDATTIVKTPVDGGPVVVLATSDDEAVSMAVDAEYLFWSELQRKISRVPKAGGSPETIVDIDGHPTVLALDETHVYATLTDTNQLLMAPKTPGEPTFLPDQNTPIWVVADLSHIYWINQGSAANTGELVRAPLGDLTHAEVLLQGLDSPVALAVSPTDVYYVAGNELLRFAKVGGTPVGVRSGLDQTKSIASYSDSVYLASNVGLIRVTAVDSTTLDARATLGLAVACSGVFATGWFVPTLLRFAP
jgi:hypothetical protein